MSLFELFVSRNIALLIIILKGNCMTLLEQSSLITRISFLERQSMFYFLILSLLDIDLKSRSIVVYSVDFTYSCSLDTLRDLLRRWSLATSVVLVVRKRRQRGLV